MQTDTAYRRFRLASRTADTHIQNAAYALNRRDWDTVFMECSRAVTEYLADKLNVPAAGLTPSDIEAVLSERGAASALLTEIVQFLEGCDHGRFSSTSRSPGVARDYIERGCRIIERLEREGAIER